MAIYTVVGISSWEMKFDGSDTASRGYNYHLLCEEEESSSNFTGRRVAVFGCMSSKVNMWTEKGLFIPSVGDMVIPIPVNGRKDKVDMFMEVPKVLKG